MNVITIWNKGKRTWPLKNSAGVEVRVEPMESVEVEEVYGLKMVNAYPKDLTTTGVAAPSLEDIKRREQSVNDREKSLKEKEKALDEREKALEAREKGLPANDAPEGGAPGAKKRGRPARGDSDADKAE